MPNLKFLRQGAVKLGLFPLLMDLRTYARDPGTRKILWADYKDTLARTAFIRAQPWRRDPGKTVLVLSLSDMVYQVKLESMLCLGLMMKGWRPVILTSRALTMAHRVFRAHGIVDFLFWEDIGLTSDEEAASARDAEEFLRKEMDFRTVKEWTYRNVWIGPQILSSIVRSGHLGSPDVNDPAMRAEIRKNLPDILKLIYRAQRMLEKARAAMVLLIEANGAVYGPLTDLAINSGINTIQFVQPWKDDALVMKRLTKRTRRIHPNSVEKESLTALEARGWTAAQDEALMGMLESRYSGKWFLQSRNQPNTRAFAKEEIVRQLGLDPGKKIAVVFSHILWDANLFYGDDLFEDYGDWFVRTVGAAIENPNLTWLIKLHPANVWKRARDQVQGELAELILIHKHFPTLPDHVKLVHPDAPISTLSLFQSIDYGVTVRGTVGIELPCFGVPLFTAGTGRYSGLGFTYDSASREEYLGKMARLHEYGRMTELETRLAKLHAYAVFESRPWEMKSFKAEFRYQKSGHSPLDHNLILQAKSLEEIRRNGDLEKWSAWAESVQSLDYLSPGKG